MKLKRDRLKMPFLGAMICSSCGARAQGPAEVAGWRALDANGMLRYYACPDCHPADDEAESVWKGWFIEKVALLFEMNRQKPFERLVWWRELGPGRAMQYPLEAHYSEAERTKDESR
jgi:hypothetical protein